MGLRFISGFIVKIIHVLDKLQRFTDLKTGPYSLLPTSSRSREAEECNKMGTVPLTNRDLQCIFSNTVPNNT